MRVEADKEKGSPISMSGAKEPTGVYIPKDMTNGRKSELHICSIVYS